MVIVKPLPPDQVCETLVIIITLPAVLPPEPPLRLSELQMMLPPKLDDPPLMLTTKLGARMDPPVMFTMSPKLAGSTSGPCTALPPLMHMRSRSTRPRSASEVAPAMQSSTSAIPHCPRSASR